MNILSFTTKANPVYGLEFHLLVDQKTLSEVLGTNEMESSLPFWLIEGDLAASDECPSALNDVDRIVAVCGCGEFGCGAITARVTKNDATVIISEFKTASSNAITEVIEVTRANYDDVLSQMTKIASLYKLEKST